MGRRTCFSNKKTPWLNKILKNKDADYENKYGTLEGRVSSSTIKKNISYKGVDGKYQRALLKNLDKVFENAVVIHSKPDEKGGNTVSKIHTLLSAVRFSDGKIGIIKLNVKEYYPKNQTNKIHENKILEIKNDLGLIDGLPSVEMEMTISPKSSKISVAELIKSVKNTEYFPVENDTINAVSTENNVYMLENSLDEYTDINDNPTGHTVEEMRIIKKFKNAVDADFVDYIQRARTDAYVGNYTVTKTNSRTEQAMRELTGLQKVGSNIVANKNTIQHIDNGHGKSGDADSTMVNDEDIARMKYVIDNFDNAYLSIKDTKATKLKSGYNAPMVIFEKKVDGTYVVVEAVTDAKSNNNLIISAYFAKNGIDKTKIKEEWQVSKAESDKSQSADFTAKPLPSNSSKLSVSQSQKENQDNLPESVGAMKADPKKMSHLVNKYGETKPGENPARFVSVPVSTDGKDRVAKAIGTIMEADVTKEKMQARFEKLVADGVFSHDVMHNKETADRAINYIEKYGFAKTYDNWRNKIDNKLLITADDIAQAIMMYTAAADVEEYDITDILAADIAAMTVNSGQVSQVIRILKKTSPQGRLYYAQKSVEAIQDDVNEKYGDKAPKLEVPEKLLDNLKKARTDEEIRTIFKYINKIESITNRRVIRTVMFQFFL